jgi:hypothetical protein
MLLHTYLCDDWFWSKLNLNSKFNLKMICKLWKIKRKEIFFLPPPFLILGLLAHLPVGPLTLFPSLPHPSPSWAGPT